MATTQTTTQTTTQAATQATTTARAAARTQTTFSPTRIRRLKTATADLRQEPTADYVAYRFEFWETYEGYQTAAVRQEPAAARADAAQYYTAVYGDSFWRIATDHGLTLEGLLALNPQVKNPNILHVGDVLRVR